ncbi:MAG: hypothetical protein ACQEQV_08080 [Fibrobacterota bacterium]
MGLMKKCMSAAVLVSALAAQGADFDVSGFMDVQGLKFFMDDDNLLLAQGYDNSFRFQSGNINAYFDFSPNNSIRTMTELGFHWQPHGSYMPTVNYMYNGTTMGTKPGYTSKDTVDFLTSSAVPKLSVSLQRSWLEYQLSQYLNVRIGKFLTPAGIWNVDHGSPAIVTAFQPYSTGLVPIFPTSQTGVMVRGKRFIGAYDLKYSAYFSTGRSMQPVDEAADLSVGGNVKFLSMDWGDGFEFGISGYTGVERELDRYTEIALKPMIDPSTGDPVLDENNDPVMIPTGEVSSGYTEKKSSREHIFGADVKFENSGLLLQSEFSYNFLKNQLMNDAESSIFGTYFLAGYRFRFTDNFSLMPYGLVEMIRADDVYEYDETMPNNNVEINGTAINPLNDRQIFSSGYAEDLTTFIGGINMKVFTKSSIKLEYSHLNFNKDVNTDTQNDDMDFGVLNLQFSVAY